MNNNDTLAYVMIFSLVVGYVIGYSAANSGHSLPDDEPPAVCGY